MESLVATGYPDLELLVVMDGFTRLRWQRARELERRFPGIVRGAWGKLLYDCDRLRRRGERVRAARLLLASAAVVPLFAPRIGFWRSLVHAGLPGARA